MPQPTIVLVHGAWADGASWNAVSAELQGRGFTVLTPPSLLHRVAGDAAYVASFLAQRTTGPVVLVGHSYGDVVITNAGAAGGDVKALVYVDAFIPEVGETVFQILGGSGSALDVPDPSAVLDIAGYPGAPEGDAEAFLEPSTVHDAFAQDLPEAERWLIVASQRPITLGENTAPTETAAWKTIPSRAVVGTEDRVIPPATQRRMAERAGPTITEVAGSHVSMGVPSCGCDRRHPRRRCHRRLARHLLRWVNARAARRLIAAGPIADEGCWHTDPPVGCRARRCRAAGLAGIRSRLAVAPASVTQKGGTT